MSQTNESEKPENPSAFPISFPKKTEWAWWSWHYRQKKWFRSSFTGETKEQAMDARKDPLASELDRYHNILVEETTTFRIPVTEKPKKGAK